MFFKGIISDPSKRYFKNIKKNYEKTDLSNMKDYISNLNEKLNREKDFHIHLVGPEGKYHPNAWSRKVKERRRWEKIEFNITPKERAFRIYVKSGYREIPACLNYNKSRRN